MELEPSFAHLGAFHVISPLYCFRTRFSTIFPPQVIIFADFCGLSFLLMDSKAFCRDARMHVKQNKRWTDSQITWKNGVIQRKPETDSIFSKAPSIVGIRYGKFSGHCLLNNRPRLRIQKKQEEIPYGQ